MNNINDLDITVFTVGEDCPLDNYSPNSDGSVITILGSCLILVKYYNKLNSEELSILRKAPIGYSVIYHKHIPILLVTFKNTFLKFVCVPLFSGQNLKQLLNQDIHSLHIIIVESSNNIVEAIRIRDLPKEVMEKLKEESVALVAHYSNTEEIERIANDFLDNISFQELFALPDQFYYPES